MVYFYTMRVQRNASSVIVSGVLAIVLFLEATSHYCIYPGFWYLVNAIKRYLHIPYVLAHW